VHKWISAITVVLIGLLGILGCGGDSTISRAEYERQIELACNKGLKEREELFSHMTVEYERRARTASQREQAEEQAGNVRQLMAGYQETTEEIADVGFPEKGRKMAEALLEAREDGTARLIAHPQEFAEWTAIFAKAAKAANGLGVASCGK
jgi:hypothetical protein